jgi:uncharacterized protein (DUF983 family)
MGGLEPPIHQASESEPVTPNVVQASLLGRCPRCGQGRLFDGYLSIAPACTVCGQDFKSFDVGDGAAALVILVVGAIVCGLALWVEFTFQPPLWVHAVLWAPLIAVLTFVFLRLVKSALLVLQYRHKAGEGRIAD